MKKIILMLASVVATWSAHAQLYIGEGALLQAGTAAVSTLSIHSGDFINDGVFNAGISDVYFISTAGDNPSISGSSPTAFDYLYVNTGAQDLVLEQDIDAALVLFVSGRFDLNGNDVRLGENIVDENDSRHFIGPNGGAIIHQASLNAPGGENPGNLGATISSAANLGEVTISRTHVPAVNDGGESIARRYTITPANNNGLDATLRFAYLPHELNGLPENELELWQNSGDGWNLEGATNRDPAANWVELSGIDSFADWTAATPGFTPVIELDGKGTMTISNPFPNPLQPGERLTVAIHSPAAINAQLCLTDQLGRELRCQALRLLNGEQQAGLETHGLPAGLYYLRVSAAQGQQTMKVVIQ
jgi:hypothetical protein